MSRKMAEREGIEPITGTCPVFFSKEVQRTNVCLLSIGDHAPACLRDGFTLDGPEVTALSGTQYLSKMAEGVGFEPTGLIRPFGFQDRCLNPLSQPSVKMVFPQGIEP
jgi:hypothetical protein